MIPTLFIDDGTSPLLRNLIAYKQSNRYVAPFFSCLGITFHKKTSNYLLDIKFKSEELMIPTLFIDDGIGPFLRNLVAYEQSNRYVAPFFSSCCFPGLLSGYSRRYKHSS